MNTKHPAAKTSVNQIPAAFTNKVIAQLLRDGTNLDFGGGRFDTATKYLEDTVNCSNRVFDPYTRTQEHNDKVLQETDYTSITCLNVLNVIPSKTKRRSAIQEVHKHTFDRHLNIAVFQVYEGNKSGITKGTQANLPPAEYLQEIQSVFGGSSWEYQTLGTKKNIFLLTYKG